MPDSEKPRRARRATSRSSRKAETNGGPADPAQLTEEQEFVDQPLEQMLQVAVTSQPDQGLLEADLLVTEKQQDNGNGLTYDGSVRSLLRNQEFIERVVNAMVENGLINSLVGDIADKLGDALQGNEAFKNQLLQAVASSEAFRAKLIRALIKSLSQA